MDWAVEFYTRQDEWSGSYRRDVDQHHREKVTAIERHAGPGPKRVLELGCGGGQHAVAAAECGHHVVAIEIVPTAVEHAVGLAISAGPGTVDVRHGDFHDVEPGGTFDVVCYWDGFGIGSDADQRRLLRRIVHWLEPGGCALLDIYNPFHAVRTVGREMEFGRTKRRYDFDAEGCRWIDEWWPEGDRSRSVTQSLRCYSPADLQLLLEGTGLTLAGVESSGAYDEATGHWSPNADLTRAIWYLARIVAT